MDDAISAAAHTSDENVTILVQRTCLPSVANFPRQLISRTHSSTQLPLWLTLYLEHQIPESTQNSNVPDAYSLEVICALLFPILIYSAGSRVQGSGAFFLSI